MTDKPGSIVLGAEFDTPNVDVATGAAHQAFADYRATTPSHRGDFITTVADEIERDTDAIVEAAVAESHLPLARIEGEVRRTTGQLRMFAGVARKGDHLGVRIDPSLPDRRPVPRPDIRQRHIPVGPVAVFGASNFPIAFSTAGGDTASALAAGCPVVVKGHPAHPRAGWLVARAVVRAVEASGLHSGVFGFLLADDGERSVELGQNLVRDPRIKAVGFTGSRAGGLAIAAAAAARREPIPVHAEMSSINPVVVLPGALAHGDVAGLASAYVGSLTLGAGQFCTNPGLLFLPSGPAGDAFLTAAGEAVARSTGQTMLTPGIASAYGSGTAALRRVEGVQVVAQGDAGGDQAPAPLLLESASLDGVENEVFGPTGVVVRYVTLDDLVRHLTALEGQLTATVQYDPADEDDARRLLPVLEDRVGRILFNGWPTGVEVGHAIVHGGPFPATTDARTTSVGSLAIERWQRPVCYQDVPFGLLPDAVRDSNPWVLTQRVDGELRVP